MTYQEEQTKNLAILKQAMLLYFKAKPSKKAIFEDEITEKLNDTLPHGSGIDCDWCFTFQKNGKIRCSNSWHKMNDNGFYCGFTDFYFTLMFADRRIILSPVKMAKGERYGVREYLNDMFYSFECELNN
jgi:hypothetical protein